MVAFAETSPYERRARTSNHAGSPSCVGRQKSKTRFHRNQQYSITALTDGTGSIVERYAYTAYGEPTFLDGSGTVLTSSAEDNRYTYTGREWDELLGLYHYRARMYDATEGAFCSRDPIGYEGSEWNLYEYVNSGPTVFVDPFGMRAAIPDWSFHDNGIRVRVAIKGGIECHTKFQDPDWNTEFDGCSGVPNTYPGFDFTVACNLHDECYQTCGAKQALCDEQMYNKMRDICAGADDWYDRFTCRLAANIYYRGLRLLGNGAFDDRQRTVCDWRPCYYDCEGNIHISP